MPRKQNGFGSPGSFSFKSNSGFDKSLKIGAPGNYPSDEGMALINRTIIEKYNLTVTGLNGARATNITTNCGTAGLA